MNSQSSLILSPNSKNYQQTRQNIHFYMKPCRIGTPSNPHGVTKVWVNSCSVTVTHYAPFTAVNTSQYSSLKTAVISLSAVPQETLTIHTPASPGKHAPFTQPILWQCENRCKGVANRDIAPYCAWSVILGWMRFVVLSTRNKHSVRCAECEAPFQLTRGRLHDRDEAGAPCLLRNSIALRRWKKRGIMIKKLNWRPLTKQDSAHLIISFFA